MPIRSAEATISEITREQEAQTPESKPTKKTLADLTSNLARGYRSLLDDWRRRGKSTKYYTEPATFLTELIMFAETEAEQAPSPFIADLFLQAGLDEEQKAKLRELIRAQIDIIDDYVQALFAEKEKGPEKTEQFKLKQSIFNQKLSLYFYLASNRRDSSYEAANLLSYLAQAVGELDLPGGKDLLVILNGARAQAAICSTLTEAGYEITLPDFNDPEEMKSWDLHGIDLVAISPNRRIILIDAKGKRIKQTDGRIQFSAEVTAKRKTIRSEHQEVVEQIIILDRESTDPSPRLGLRSGEAIRLEVTVPTEKLFMSRVGQLDKTTQRILLRRLELN